MLLLIKSGFLLRANDYKNRSQKKYQTMQDLSMKFQGSPLKFGKAAYCDLFYTESKLYDHVLYKDLINYKDLYNYKVDVMTLQAIKQHLQSKYFYSTLQKNTIIQTQQQQLNFLRQRNRQLTTKNLQRTKQIILNHNETLQALIKQKEEETLVVQSQKQLLQNRISQLENELAKNVAIVNNIQNERQEMSRKDKERTKQSEVNQLKLKQKQQGYLLMEREYKEKINQLNEEKLEIQLYFKKMMVEHSQAYKRQLDELEVYYQKKLEILQEEKLSESLRSKQGLSKVIKNNDLSAKQNRQRILQFQQLAENLRKQLQFEKQKNSSLSTDIQKQDDILDKYEIYLKESDENILKLKQLLLQSQEEMQRAKSSMQKNIIQRDSFANRIKICEQEARMWRQNYYLNKSRGEMEN